MTFGTIYGMYSKKAGETLNVNKQEGQIVINTIKAELPQTFAMVEAATLAASKQGYVILNYRTNSRRWFPRLIAQLKNEINKDTHFIEISAEESEARNVRIQGTQADFIKEATVVLATYYRKHKLDAKILMWVHDEIVDKVSDNLILSDTNTSLDNCEAMKEYLKRIVQVLGGFSQNEPNDNLKIICDLLGVDSDPQGLSDCDLSKDYVKRISKMLGAE